MQRRQLREDLIRLVDCRLLQDTRREALDVLRVRGLDLVTILARLERVDDVVHRVFALVLVVRL